MLRLLQVTCVMCEAAAAGAGPADAGGGGGEFVDGWLVAQVLGEGAYGEVRLLVHRGSGAAVALKAVRGSGRREAALHGALRHAHVLRCLGARAHGDAHYLFLEYASGGELFERIEPDRGMAAARARTYWRQLAAGLRYLHARGVAHRDIKPENLLLDAEDRIKISDFGLATVFRHGARERRLSRVCGTPPYCAPEVLCAAARPYRAQPADAWAAAVVLLAMLAGELPWERAHAGDARYAEWSAWSCGRGVARPQGVWRRVAGGALAWLRRALHPEPARRAGLEELARDAWLAAPHDPDDRAALAGGGAGARGCLSQPAGGGGGDEADGGGGQLSPADMAEALLSYSQPAHADDLLLGTQAEGWAGAGAGSGSEGWATARRMTRVWVRGDAAAALRALAAALRDRHYTWRHVANTHLAIECGPEVRMRAWAGAGAGDVTLLEFRRARGCGLEFKRRFVELRAALEPLSVPAPAPSPHPAPPPPPEPMEHT